MAKDDRDDIDKLFDAAKADDDKAALRAGKAIARRVLTALETIAESLKKIADRA